MEYKNDERYYNIKRLNKWFAISSILFFLSMLWLFYYDNDDEWRLYQRNYDIIHKDLLNKKINKNVKSYWISRKDPMGTMKNQF